MLAGFQIAMHDSVLMHVSQRLADATGDFGRIGFRQWPHVAQQFAQGLAFEIFHREVRPALFFRREEYFRIYG